MNVDEAQDLMIELIEKYCDKMYVDLSKCIVTSKMKSAFGKVYYRQWNSWPHIQLSKKFVECNDELHVTFTILHEIAHLLTPGASHRKKWRDKFRELLDSNWIEIDKITRYAPREIHGVELIMPPRRVK